jgi:uncharacterized protein YbjT (DUF2867 family)
MASAKLALYLRVMPLHVTVFGGTGFLGRRIVRHLHDAGLVARVACRHPDAVPPLFAREVSGIETVQGSRDTEAVVEAAGMAVMLKQQAGV